MIVTEYPPVVSQKIEELKEEMRQADIAEARRNIQFNKKMQNAIMEKFRSQFDYRDEVIYFDEEPAIVLGNLRFVNSTRIWADEFTASNVWWLHGRCPDCGAWRPYRKGVESWEGVALLIYKEMWDDCPNWQEHPKKYGDDLASQPSKYAKMERAIDEAKDWLYGDRGAKADAQAAALIVIAEALTEFIQIYAELHA